MKQVFLMGPTASGKTGIATQLFQELKLQLVSVDATQIYSDCNIGSAKLPADDLKKYPHELISIISPSDNFSVDHFLNHYQQILDQLNGTGINPLLVGGTMMYFNAILNPLDDIPRSTPDVRKHVEELVNVNGLDWLAAKVKEVDPLSKIVNTDKQRLMRSYEVFLISNQPLSSFYNRTTKQDSTHDKDILKIALVPNDRKNLHDAISLRTKTMLEEGLVEEVEELFVKYPELSWNSNSMRSIGYRQVGMFLRGEIKQEELFD
ncbi:MAG: tRNA (adenosine(37)-N6)-dimethylallyltransferase MiaA, partial [Methylophilaceae bacterium]